MQATSRAAFVPVAPQGRYTGLGSATPQRFTPQLAPPKAVIDVHAESTRQSGPSRPLASDNSHAPLRTPYMAAGVMTGQMSLGSGVNASKDDADRAVRRNQTSILSPHQNTQGGMHPVGASFKAASKKWWRIRGDASGRSGRLSHAGD